MKVSSFVVPTGKFVTVQFVKLNGEVRTLSGRTGVTKYLKGGRKRSAATESNYFLLWTRDENGGFSKPRNINRSTIVAIKADGKRFGVNHASEYASTL